jgi:membrane protease YdiL (CAAX protease family)
LLGIFLAVRYFHKRSFLSLITPLEKIDWKKYFRGLFLMFLIASFFAVIDSLFSPGTYQFVFQWNTFLPFLLLALVLVPIQASTEELLFRGYVMQGIGQLVRNRWVVVVLSSVLFMLPHLSNPEATPSPALAATVYIFVGVFLAVITLKSHSLELAMGAHTGMNLFNVFLGSSADQMFSKIPTVFIRHEDSAINVETLLVMLLAFVLFYWVCFSGNRVFRSSLSVE